LLLCTSHFLWFLFLKSDFKKWIFLTRIFTNKNLETISLPFVYFSFHFFFTSVFIFVTTKKIFSFLFKNEIKKGIKFFYIYFFGSSTFVLPHSELLRKILTDRNFYSSIHILPSRVSESARLMIHWKCGMKTYLEKYTLPCYPRFLYDDDEKRGEWGEGG